MPRHQQTTVAALLSLALTAPLSAQERLPANHTWFVEAGLGALRVIEQGPASNITTGGTAPLSTARVGRSIGPRLGATVSAGYGRVGDARRDVYERPGGPTRIDRYDYRILVVGAGAEYAWPLGSVEGVAGLEAGWAWEGWRLTGSTGAAPGGMPTSNFDGGPQATARLGLRYPVTASVVITGGAQVMSGLGSLEGNGSHVLPEIALRWRF